MKAIWQNRGSDADIAKLRARGIDGACFDIREARLSSTYLKNVRAALGDVYVYVCPKAPTPNEDGTFEWAEYSNVNGALFADQVSNRLEQIAPRSGPTMPRVIADIELHDATFVRAFFRRFRQLRPTRSLIWTLEPFQFGWVELGVFRKGWASAVVLDILEAEVLVAPQFYKGDMTPFAADRVLWNAVMGGVPEELLVGCYDAARLDEGWYGIAFHNGRLP